MRPTSGHGTDANHQRRVRECKSLVVASNDIFILAGFPGGASSRYSKSNVKVLKDGGLAFEESDITYSSSNDMGCRRTKVGR